MEKFEKILELLEKKSISASEKKLLEEFANSDEEIKSFISTYQKLSSSFSAAGHIPTDLLAEYILFEREEESENRLIQLLKEKIKSHLKDCIVCKNEYDSLLVEYSKVQVHVDRSIVRTAKSSLDKKKLIIPSISRQSSYFKYAFATLAVIFIAYIGLFFVSSSVTPDYKKNIFPNEQEEFYKTRGRTSPLFQKGLNAIDKGDYSKAIEFLSEDIAKHQNEKSIFYTHYIIGMTYLKAAESDFFGLFRSYNADKVNLAIANLKESVDKNNSGDYESLKLDSYYYMGRAYLLIDNSDEAISYLEKVIIGKGRYSKEAVQLIGKLEKN